MLIDTKNFITSDEIDKNEIGNVITTRIKELASGAESTLEDWELNVPLTELTAEELKKIDIDDIIELETVSYIRLSKSSDIAIREFNLGKCNLVVRREVYDGDILKKEDRRVNELIRPIIPYFTYS